MYNLLRFTRDKAATMIQKAWRRYRIFNLIPKALKFRKAQAVLVVQKYLRGYKVFRKYERILARTNFRFSMNKITATLKLIKTLEVNKAKERRAEEVKHKLSSKRKKFKARVRSKSEISDSFNFKPALRLQKQNSVEFSPIEGDLLSIVPKPSVPTITATPFPCYYKPELYKHISASH